ncbi:hypothetical protein BGZ72_009361 [Mortierella alpina]|nr:hypothetical protein BGZ72_009361 [Mortierella alpina]
MSESTAQTALAIPELLLLVSAHLDPYDLAQCMVVCRAWSLLLEPILWTNFYASSRDAESLGETPPSPLKAALIRNLPFIRSIDVSYANVTLLQALIHASTTDPRKSCTNLNRLEFKDLDYQDLELSSQYLATLLDLNGRLTHLDLPFEFLGIDAVPTAISKLGNLQHLSIYSQEESEDTRAITLLLQACLPLPHLTELFLDMDLSWCDDEQDILNRKSVIEEASRARFSRHPSANKIRSLRLPSNVLGYQNPLPLLLFESNLLDLESCEIPWFDLATYPEEIEQIVRKRCSNIKYLTCPSFRRRYQYDQIVCAFLRGCPGIKRFDADDFSEYGSDRYSAEPDTILSILASQHCDTLEDFELTGCYQASSHGQQAILSQCKRLRRFWVKDTYAEYSSVGIEFSDICRGEWVCMDLATLSLTLNRHPKEEDAFEYLELEIWESLDNKQRQEAYEEREEDLRTRMISIAAQRVYAQIGRLEKLEELELDIDISRRTEAKEGDYAWDLTLAKGWLCELAGLKKLKTLRLHADFWSKMGQAEVEFMHEQWPLLSAIFVNTKVSQMRAQSHWQWLLNKRPQLRLAF